MENYGITFADVRRSQAEEVILLREPKLRNDKAGPLIEYEDTDETTKMRDKLRSINCWLEKADIESDLTCTEDRRLQWIFNNADFRQGGRLRGVAEARKKARSARIGIYGSTIPKIQGCADNDSHPIKLQASDIAHELAHVLMGHPPMPF